MDLLCSWPGSRRDDLHRSRQRITELVPGKKVVWQVLDSEIAFVKDKNEWNGTEIVFEISDKNGPAADLEARVVAIEYAGNAAMARLEAQTVPSLLRDVKFGLVELDRIARGRLRANVQQAKVLLVPAVAQMERASSEMMLDPLVLHDLRVCFEARLRD